jgi:hypothetical protein
MNTSANTPIKGISSIQCESKENKRQTRERSDIMETIDIDFVCKRSRFSDALLIHLYCRKTRQQKDKITIKRTDKLNKLEDKMSNALADVSIIISTAEMISALTISKTSCNTLIPFDFIFERQKINAKRNGTVIILINDKIMFNLLKI